MKHIIKTTLLACSLLAGCMDLDKDPLDMISDKAVFRNEALTKAYLYNIYGYMPCGYGLMVEGGAQVNTGLGITDLLDGSTDLLRSPAGWNESNGTMIPGTISAVYNPMENWGRCYEVIRKANNLLANLAAEGPLPADFRERVSAEARFVRAYMYFDLVRRYGDVPLIEEVQGFDNLQQILVARTPQAEIWDFLDRELDAIGKILPAAADLPASELGRATREAAWALGGRAMLFAERWARSAEYSDRVISQGPFELNSDYNALFQSRGGDPEVIFEVLYDGNNRGHCADNLYMPPSIDNGWGSQTNPTQEIVDSYEMLDGTPFDWNNPAHAADPYANRDKRLQASIIVDGAQFKGKTIRTAWLVPDDGMGLIERTYTGYYLRKFLDETLPFEKLLFGGSQTSWKEIRLAEVLLNYAEAQNAASGPDQSVYDAVNAVRSRAGLPDLPEGLDAAQMHRRIVQERKVELAFEGHRFWDLRRWRIAEQVLHNKYFHGVKITENADGTKNYEVIEVSNVPRQVFLPKHYLMPLNQGELEKNPNLGANNEGY